VLLLYGGKDNLVMTGASIARAKELNPNVQSKVYAKSGHAPFLEEASRFNKDLVEFANSTQAVK
jgi:pimeloyl-ACP methyl ester carboxylesterase